MVKKKILLFLGIITALPTLARDFEYIYEGQTLTYTVLDEDAKTCEIMSWGGAENSVSGTLLIPETVSDGINEYTVTSIGEYAFYGCSGLTSVSIPQSITFIGSWAFDDCTSLTKAEYASIESLCCIKFENYSSNPLFYAEHLYVNGEEITDLVIPESVTSIGEYVFEGGRNLASVTIPTSVITINAGAFGNCYGIQKVEYASIESLCNIDFYDSDSNPFYAHNAQNKLYINGQEVKNLVIPFSVDLIKPYVFYGCSGLTSVAIPNTIRSIGERAFAECRGLTSITIPTSVSSIDFSAFQGCTGLTSLTIPPTVSSLDGFAFNNCQLSPLCIKCPYSSINDKKNVFYGLKSGSNIACRYEDMGEFSSLTPKDVEIWPWDFPYRYDVEGLTYSVKVSEIKSPYFDNTIAIKNVQAVVYNGTSEVKRIILKESDNYINGLVWNTNYTLKIIVTEESGNTYILDTFDFSTDSGPKMSTTIGPTSVTITAIFGNEADRGDRCWWELNGKTYEGTVLQAISLMPNSQYSAVFKISYNGRNYSTTQSFSTSELTFKTLNPKGVSATCSIVAAETNISADEPRVGFQWKKYDAPASLAPTEGYAVVCDGLLEGYIKNLQSAFYYNVRPFYKDADDNYYYGDWVTFDPSDFSYFEPTVRTYPVESVTSSSVTIRGYALPGSDNIRSQGFQYWKNDETYVSEMLPLANNAVHTIEVSGQLMTATLDDLEAGATYAYRAFVQTDTGYTYGEEHTFTTMGLSTISTVEAEEMTTVIGYYDMMGRRYKEPQPGLNIIVYSNGTAKKIFISR